MKKILSLIAMMLTVITVNAATYSIKVKGITVTDANKNDVLGDGTVKFQNSDNTLVLNNANITYNHASPVIISHDNPSATSKTFKIKLIGTNKIVTEMDYNGLHANPQGVDSTLIYSTSGGTLNISVRSGYCALRKTGKKLTFKNCTVTLNNSSTTGQALLGDEKQNSEFSFINATVNAYTSGKHAISNVSSLKFHSCFMKTPGDAVIGPDHQLTTLSSATNRFEVATGKDNVKPFLLYGNTLTVTDVKAHSAKIYFNRAMDNRSDYKKIKYHIYIAKDRISGLWEQDYDLSLSIGTAPLSTLITDLADNQKYAIRLKATDEAGNYVIYTDLEFTTAKDNVPTLPADHAIRYTVTPRTISLSWKPATDDYSAASKLKYTVEYKKEGNVTGWTMPEVGNATSYIIQDLMPNTTYLVDVKVADEAGKYIRYGEIKVTTAIEDAVENITLDTDLNAKARNLHGITVNDSYRGIIIRNGRKYIKR